MPPYSVQAGVLFLRWSFWSGPTLRRTKILQFPNALAGAASHLFLLAGGLQVSSVGWELVQNAESHAHPGPVDSETAI